MNEVATVAYGSTKFSDDDISVEDILLSATKSLFDQTPNLSQNDIDTVLVSTNENGQYLGPILSELSGIKPNISHKIENLCSSGASSIVSAYSYIASGLSDTVLVVGADRYDSPGRLLEWDDARGEYTNPIFWASLFTKSYKRKFNLSEEELAIVSAKNHKNAIDNPNAYSNKAYTIPEIMNSKQITDDLRLLDCSKPCTGGSAILMTSKKSSKKFTDTPVWIKGIGQKTTSASFTKNNDFTGLESTKIASIDSFNMAKMSPNDIDVAEIHDAFSICEIMELEDIGFTKKGKGAEYVRTLFNTEDKKINPRGGLIGSGHPLGATGIAQTIEITQQLQNNAGKKQISNAKSGLVHNMSAAATSSAVIILES